MEETLKRNLTLFIADCIYEKSDLEYILNEFYGVFTDAITLAKAWENGEGTALDNE